MPPDAGFGVDCGVPRLAARRLGMTARDEVAFLPDKRPPGLRPATLLTQRPLVCPAWPR
jgi:hypothetical protein